ncbi:MAG TPA: twin-arginine translocase TatA/TatE family subunit [Myxococcaceae bacterium]|jgi:sec-independent protein translocase protein TatB
MFNIGAGEMIFILVAALLVLGPSRLPELARGIGKFLREFRRQTDEVRTVVTREFYQMDQEIQREPVRPAPAPVLPTPALAETATPPALGMPATPGPGPYDHMLPSPVAPVAPVEPAAPVEPSIAPVGLVAAQGVQPDAPAGAAEAAPGQSSEEEAVPRFAPIPGTVARNAPKQS